MASVNGTKSYKSNVKKHPWKNINKILSENKKLSTFEALFMKNIEKHRRAKKYVGKQFTSQPKSPIVTEESAHESTFDRILAGPVFQNLHPLESSKSDEFSSSSSAPSSSRLDTSTTYNTFDKPRALRNKKQSPSYSTRKLRSHKQSKSLNLCKTSTPKKLECLDNEKNPAVSPILQNEVSRVNNWNEEDKENDSLFVNSNEMIMEDIDRIPSKSVFHKNLNERLTRKPESLEVPVNKDYEEDSTDIKSVVSNEELSGIIHSFKNVATGSLSQSQTSDLCGEISKGKHKLSKSEHEGFLGFVNSSINNQSSVSNNSEIGGLNSKNRLPKSIGRSYILFNSWGSVHDSKDNTLDKPRGLRKKKQSPSYSVFSKRKLRSHNQSKSLNLRKSSTPKRLECLENEKSPVLSPILQNEVSRVNNWNEEDKENDSLFVNSNEMIMEDIDQISSKSVVHKNLNERTLTRKPEILEVPIKKDYQEDSIDIKIVVNSEELLGMIHSINKTTTGLLSQLQTHNLCGEISKGKQKLSNSEYEDFLGFVNPDISNESSASNNSKIGQLNTENRLHEPLEQSYILFDSWDSVHESKGDCSGRSNEDKLPAQNKKSNCHLLCRRLSHQVVPNQMKTGSSISSPSFSDVYILSRSQTVLKFKTDDIEHIHEENYRIIEEDECESSLASIPVDGLSASFTARNAVLQRCSQDYPIPFSEAFASSYWETCRKIGEGVYGEVFLSEGEDGSVLKIIPIEGEQLVNGEPQKKFDEILSEIVITMELSNLRYDMRNRTQNFSEMKSCLCVQGKYPKELIKLWDIYNDRKGSENDSPTMFREDQLYIILELANEGRDLEAYVFTSAEESLSVLIQTVYALAVAEQALEFEHRDLHWGNVLISPTSEENLVFRLCGEEFIVPTKGVEVGIIDFTLSRMSYDGCCIYNDLSRDPELFTAEGDYQFEVYRLMQKHTMNVWDKFVPYTNVLWIHYLIDKMCTMVNYDKKKKKLKCHKQALDSLLALQTVVLKSESAIQLVLGNEVDIF